MNPEDQAKRDHNGNSTHCPSFRTYTNDCQIAQIADDDNSNDDDFEFRLDGGISGIQPIYPVFDRDLLPRPEIRIPSARNQLKELFIGDDRDPQELERSSSTSSLTGAGDDLDNVPSDSYCLWAPKSPSVAPSPSPGRCTKSNSTGSASAPATSRSWRLRNLLRRCKSDGKEGIVLVTSKKNEKDKEKKGKQQSSKHAAGFLINNNNNNNIGNNRKKSNNVVYNSNYYENRGLFSPARGEKENRRRSYLPYRQELLGFFGSPKSLPRSNILPF